jgi:hypothetical protein
MSSRCTRAIGVFSIALATLGIGACAGTQAEATLVYDYPAVYVDSVPAHALYQPRVYYHGRYAYLVDGRWYYPTHRGWVVFREEPRELQRYRVRYDTHRYPGYRYDRYDTPSYRYRYGAPEYGTPAVPRSEPRYREPTPVMPPPTHYRAPASPPSSPRYRTPSPPPPSYYRAPASPRAAPPPAQAPRAAPPPAPPPPRMPALSPAPRAR